jgi:hypothetical protein
MDTTPGDFAQNTASIMDERQSDYGSPADNHGLTAALWDLWIEARTRNTRNPDPTPEDVCAFNVIQKLSRLANGTKDDSWQDIAGYAENVLRLRDDQRNRKL